MSTASSTIESGESGAVRPETARIEVVALDMAGTTVIDDGLVEAAFAAAWDRLHPGSERREEAIDWVRETMGQSKIEVFRHLLDEEGAQALNAEFEAAYARLISDGRCSAVPGAAAAIRRLKGEGRRVVLTTGFARPTADAILDALGWRELPDLVLTPADAGRGRPAPDLNLTAVLRTGASSVTALAVAGDTASDMAAGRAAGAGLVVGVLTGMLGRSQLEAAGADRVLASVAELPDLLERLGR